MNEYTKSLIYSVDDTESLSHHGVLGMKWGIRRYQPYGHGGYDPEHTRGKFIGKETAGQKKGTIGGAENARFGLAKKTTAAQQNTQKGVSSTKASKTENKERKHLSQEAKDRLKKVAVGVGIAGAVTLAVALGARTEVGRSAVRAITSKAHSVAEAVNTIDTGFSDATKQALVKQYQEKEREVIRIREAQDALQKQLKKEAWESIQEKQQKGIYAVKKMVGNNSEDPDSPPLLSLEYGVHDLYNELADSDKKVLDAFHRILEKKGAESTVAARGALTYIDAHEAPYSTKRTQRAKLQAMEVKQSLSNLATAMKAKLGSADAQIKQNQEAGRKALARLQEQKLSEALSMDITEDLKLIEDYLKLS